MKVLVIGFGSIGERHARILEELSHDVTVVSSRDISFKKALKSIPSNLEEIQYLVIASETWKHFEDLESLSNNSFKGICLCEKPLYSSLPKQNTHFSFPIYVGYNLRFHPVIKKLREVLFQQEVLSSHLYVGQNLSMWRRGREMSQTYSSDKFKGGGVIRDLSHELDLLLHLFGNCLKLHAIGGRVSNLTKDSDDAFAIVAAHERCPVVSLQMNYLDHIGQRFILINTTKHSYKVDLVDNTISGTDLNEKFSVERDDSYKLMHMTVTGNTPHPASTLAEGIEVMKMIEKAEQEAYTDA